MTNEEIEKKIKELGLEAPRITIDDIEGTIDSEEYLRSAISPTLTICVLRLTNGFSVTGESACVSPANFNEEIGKKIARANAVEKIWQLEGYRMKTDLARIALVAPLLANGE